LTAGLNLYETEGGTHVRLRVKPGARSDAILGVHAGALKVQVAAPPEKGKANDAVLRLLSEVLAVPRSCLTLTAGATSRDKVVVVHLPRRTIEERLAAHLE